MKSPIIFRIFKDGQIHFVKQFIDKDQIVVGRTDDNQSQLDIDLQSSEVSPIHCLIERRGLNYYLCDLGSIQGTFKNGLQILDEVLESGDEFQLGGFKIVFFVGVPKPVHATQSSNEIIIAPPTAMATKNREPAANKIAPVIEKKLNVVTEEPGTVYQPFKEVQVEAEAKSVAKKSAVVEDKPQIKADQKLQKISSRSQNFLSKHKKKNAKTFAAPSSFQNIFQAVRPGQGGQVEVLVAWEERILETYHFSSGESATIGFDAKVNLPMGTVVKKSNLFDSKNGQVIVYLPSEGKACVQKSDDRIEVSSSQYKLQQNEVLFITFGNGIQLAVRFAPRTALVPLDSPLIFSSSEFTGILAALIVAVLTSLIVSVMAPKNLPQEEEVERVAQVIFDRPPIKMPTEPPPPAQPVVEAPPPPPPEPQKPPEPPKKIVEADKAQKAVQQGDPSKQEAQSVKEKNVARANEVRPNDPNKKVKMLTSSKTGGAIKTGPVAGANAQSKEPDVNKSGLLSTFGSGGSRSKLDKAYSGAGELLGAGEKATGASGFNESRSGTDLGSKFKDTGAGGKGTATTGISGVGTKGRNSGMNAFGGNSGFGDKEQTAIALGGEEAEFVGSIDREAVRRAVRSQINFFKSCYEREYKKNTQLEGKVVISWEIHEKGVAKNAKVVRDKSTINNPAVEECVRSRMLTIRFPEPPEGTVAEVSGYPFVFSGLK